MGLVVNQIDYDIKPKKRVNKFVIPGRNGTYNRTDGTLENRKITMHCSVVRANQDLLAAAIRGICKWLDGGGELEIDSEPGKFYGAESWETVSTSKIQRNVRDFEIAFECQPLAYSEPHALQQQITQNDQLLEVTSAGNYEAPCKIEILNTGSTSIHNIKISYKTEVM